MRPMRTGYTKHEHEAEHSQSVWCTVLCQIIDSSMVLIPFIRRAFGHNSMKHKKAKSRLELESQIRGLLEAKVHCHQILRKHTVDLCSYISHEKRHFTMTQVQLGRRDSFCPTFVCLLTTNKDSSSEYLIPINQYVFIEIPLPLRS